jgi:hypothetical protein
VVSASIGIAVGLIIGRAQAPREPVPKASRPAASSDDTRTGRDVYSPRVATDPYVIEQQRQVLRALEASCLQSKQHCAEAEQARRRLEEVGSGG